MSQTDPIAELLTRIRNAMHARYNQVEVAAFADARSDLPHAARPRVSSAESKSRGEVPKKKLLAGLRYSATREPVIRGIERVSRPSMRRYAGANSMPRVPRGMGVQVVTTPLGVMTDREARRKKVGGEILLRIW